jgi:site-specific DNA recombinase
LNANNISKNYAHHQKLHFKQYNNIPLKVFMKCDACGEPYTGYIVKAKKLYYYKCRKTGCACNKSAKQMHELFETFLEQFNIDKDLIPIVQKQLLYLFDSLNKDGTQDLISYKSALTSINAKIDTIEEKHFVLNEMSKETFEKFHKKYIEEKHQIQNQITKNTGSISNPENYLQSVLEFSAKLNTAWSSSEVSTKEKIQKLIFPEGIYYNHKNHSFRTTKINSIFSCIAQLQSISAQNKKATNHVKHDLSLLAEREGFEPPDL